MVRKAYEAQHRFDVAPIAEVELNLNCRDSMIPVLAGLQYLYTQPEFRRQAVKLVELDLNAHSRRDIGRRGMDDWQVVVLAAVRLGCNLTYDELHDLTDNHRALRGIMGIGDWSDGHAFSFRRIQDTITRVSPETIEKISQLVVRAGHNLDPEACRRVRADSFVVETNIHHPTESSLILDGMRKLMPICIELAAELGVEGWRQASHLLTGIRKRATKISRIAASKSSKKGEAMKSAYADLLERARLLLDRAKALVDAEKAGHGTESTLQRRVELEGWIDLTTQVCDTAARRVLLGETVPNRDKLFSMFETHTQLYRRGKARTPNQFGRLVMIFEDDAGFVSHYHMLDREAADADVVVEQTRKAQAQHKGRIESASFDRGFYSKDNKQQLGEIVNVASVMPRAPGQYAAQLKTEPVVFRVARLRHPGVESAIHALQSGNGLKRCRDRSEIGFERYLGLAILGRNIHTLGKLVIAQKDPECLSAQTMRAA